jgi:hypothetical protein
MVRIIHLHLPHPALHATVHNYQKRIGHKLAAKNAERMEDVSHLVESVPLYVHIQC